jgi:hypothetical protein
MWRVNARFANPYAGRSFSDLNPARPGREPWRPLQFTSYQPAFNPIHDLSAVTWEVRVVSISMSWWTSAAREAAIPGTRSRGLARCGHVPSRTVAQTLVSGAAV